MKILPCIAALLVGTAFADTTQEAVHHHAHDVMPFDVTKTVHIFTMTDEGGVQKVVTRDATNAAQVPLIRQHLQHEAEAFQKGDFGDPSHLHGASMPGLVDLRANPSAFRVTYSPLHDGAQLSFVATDLHIITAIHRWFGAQLSEHGADARAE
jgi:hypothetical protein